MKPAIFFGIALAALVPTSASAAIRFAYVSSSNADFASFDFVLPDDFTPASTDGNSFTTAIVTTNSATQFGPVTFDDRYRFYDSTFGGFDSMFDIYFGPVVFDGTLAAPHFINGVYNFDNGQDDGVLTISGATVSGAVPEPATWAMMIGGFGLVGGAMRRRRSVTFSQLSAA